MHDRAGMVAVTVTIILVITVVTVGIIQLVILPLKWRINDNKRKGTNLLP